MKRAPKIWFAFFAIVSGIPACNGQPPATERHGRHNSPHGGSHELAGAEYPNHVHKTDGQDEHGDDEAHGPIRLQPAVLEEMGIEVTVAAGGKFEKSIALTGELVLNPDRLAHVVPRVGGIVREVRVTIGDDVRQGDCLAVLESSELAEAKAEYLGAQQRLALSSVTLKSKKTLQETGIVSDLDFLAARRDAAEAEILLRAADVKLHTYGFSHTQLAGISAEDEEALLVYALRAPFTGTVVEKHITLGELVTNEADVFVVADISNVWGQLTVHQKDLVAVKPGQTVTVSVAHGLHEAVGTIGYVSPIVDEATRTAIARVVLPNSDGSWRPGLFVTAKVVVDEIDVAVLVPQSAIQFVEEHPSIFVRTEGGFEPREVVVGRTNEKFAEVTSGLSLGDAYVGRGAFTLKAEFEKASFVGEGHAH